MAKPLSTGDGESQDGFDSLEERIVYTEREKDREIRTSVRLANIHYSQMDIIQMELGTNKVEILARAYNAGLSELRSINFVERSDSLLDMVNALNQFSASREKYWEMAGSEEQRYQSYEVEIKESYVDSLNDPDHIPIRDSVLSEVRDRMIDVMMIKPGVHRPIVTVGLSTSDNSFPVLENYAEETICSFDDAIEESRKMCEKNMANLLSSLYPIFDSDGIEEGDLDIIKNAVGFMETEYQSSVNASIEQIERNCDVR
jgi:hypothetical protein